jgi:hypothetical protein
METARHLSQPASTLRRESARALPWPDDLLSQFGLRMASHGMSISRTQMQASPGYALEQLAHARALDDDRLQLLVVQMFRQFEAHQSGVPFASH